MSALAGVLPRRRLRHGITAMVALAVAVLLPVFGNNYMVEVGTTILLYAILCLGLNVVVGYAGLLDLGYSAFFAIGGYATGLLTSRYGINFWATIPLAMAAACLAGVLIGLPTLRLRSDYLAIVTLGFGEIIHLIARNLEITGGPSGLDGIKRPSLFGWVIEGGQAFYFLFLAALLLTIAVCTRIQDSRIGRAWRYVRYDEDAAAGIGINCVNVKLYAYMVGAAIASVAGSLFAVKMTAISPESFTFNQSVLILLGVVLGGMGNIGGVMLGAAVMTLIPEVLRDAGTYRPVVTAAALLALMLYRPGGLWPEKRGREPA